MTTFRNFQSNFSGGLLSEGMLGRVDLAQYENGCQKYKNWWPRVTGGARRRPGSAFLFGGPIGAGPTGFLDDAILIESFIFNESQTYIVIFRNSSGSPNENISIHDPDDGSKVDTLSFDWSENNIKEMSVTQKGDVMFLAHTNRKTQKITRTSATTFTLTDYEFEGQAPLGAYPKFMPFFKFTDPEVTINPSGHTGVVNIIASAPVFDDGYVNHAIRYRGKQIFITLFNTTTNLLGTVLEDLDQGAVLSFNSSINTPNDFIVGEIIVGRDSGVKAEVVETLGSSISVAMIAGKFAVNATEEIEGLTSGNIAKITGNTLTSPPAHANWDEEAFTTKRGWPGVIEFHSQRLWLGGSSSLPAHIFGSKVAAFFNFDTGDALPHESIQAAIVSKQILRIVDLVSGRHLQIFTENSEWYAPEGDDVPLIPETFNVVQQTHYGTRRGVRSAVFDESTLFVQNQGNAIREFIWRDSSRGYSSDPISLISEDAVQAVVDVEVLYGGYDRPEQMAFFVNGDGTIAWWHSARAESIRSWGVWDTQGKWKSLTVIADKLYALVERTIPNGTFFYLERFEMNHTLDCTRTQVNLDGTKTFLVPQSVWSGAAGHIDDALVSVTTAESPPITEDAGLLTEGSEADFYLGEFTLSSSGGLTLDAGPVHNITVGFNYTQELEPMPFEVKDTEGVTGGLPKRLVAVDVFIVSSLALKLNGQKMLTFKVEDDITKKPKLVKGNQKFWLLGYSERPTVTITNDIPLPCEVLAIAAEVEY